MSAYRFDDPDGLYFVTFTVVEWIDVFTREKYSQIVLESLKYCQKEKGLVIHAWVIMSNHLHLIISRNKEGVAFSDIVRDFKKFTATRIIASIRENAHESRRNWMNWIFKTKGERNRNNVYVQFWKQDSHAELLYSNKFMDQKLDYIHMNPVRAGIVDEPEYYRHSSARDYCGQKGLLEIVFIE